MPWLDSMYAGHSFGLDYVAFEPAFDFLRGDVRFMRFVHALPWHPSLAFATSSPRRR